MPDSVARSSACELEDRHCPAAARHQEIGTPRDRKAMAVGTCVHHMLAAVIGRSDGELETAAIDREAQLLIANGRAFEDGPVEFASMNDVDRARDHALVFLDREEIPEGAEWMRAERSVDLDAHFRIVPRGEPAIWRQTLDVAAILREEVDDMEITVIEITDWKGGNISEAWFDTLQGKGAAVSAVALAEKLGVPVDQVRRRVVSYMPWGGKFERTLDLHDRDHLDMLDDYRESLRIASASHKDRQDRTPEELAQPGAGCSAGFAGCPFFARCAPAGDAFQDAASWTAPSIKRLADQPDLVVSNAAQAARVFALASAMRQEAAKVVKVALRSSETVSDGKGSLVGWKKKNRSEVTDNAPLLLAREWAEAALRMDPGSQAAIDAAARIEGLLRVKKALGVTTVRAIIDRLGEILTPEECESIEARCLEDNPTRTLACWKGKS